MGEVVKFPPRSLRAELRDRDLDELCKKASDLIRLQRARKALADPQSVEGADHYLGSPDPTFPGGSAA